VNGWLEVEKRWKRDGDGDEGWMDGVGSNFHKDMR